MHGGAEAGEAAANHNDGMGLVHSVCVVYCGGAAPCTPAGGCFRWAFAGRLRPLHPRWRDVPHLQTSPHGCAFSATRPVVMPVGAHALVM
jgi:hypothetical protein